MDDDDDDRCCHSLVSEYGERLLEQYRLWQNEQTVRYELTTPFTKEDLSLLPDKYRNLVTRCLTVVTGKYINCIKRVGGAFDNLKTYKDQEEKLNMDKEDLERRVQSLIDEPDASIHEIGLYCKKLLNTAAEPPAKMPEGGKWEPNDTYVMLVEGNKTTANVKHIFLDEAEAIEKQQEDVVVSCTKKEGEGEKEENNNNNNTPDVIDYSTNKRSAADLAPYDLPAGSFDNGPIMMQRPQATAPSITN